MLSAVAVDSGAFIGKMHVPGFQGRMDSGYRSEEIPASSATTGAFMNNALIVTHLYLVRLVARQIHIRVPKHIEIEELVAAGNLGLVDAASKFEGAKQVQFRSYAQFRIRGAILDYLREMDWSPRFLRRQERQIEQACRTLEAKGICAPDDTHIAEVMGLTLAKYQQVVQDLHQLDVGSLHTVQMHSLGEEGISCLPGPTTEDPLLQCLAGQTRERITSAIDILPERERVLLSLYYYEELSMKDISIALGVCASRVSQLHFSAVSRLRVILEELSA